MNAAFIALRLIVAVSSLSSSSAVSPERKKIPGIAEGTVRLSTAMVAAATAAGGALGPLMPFLTMLGLSTAPARGGASDATRDEACFGRARSEHSSRNPRTRRRALEVDAVELERRELRREHLLGDRRADLDAVRAVGHDLGLHDGHEPVLMLGVVGRGRGLGFGA